MRPLRTAGTVVAAALAVACGAATAPQATTPTAPQATTQTAPPAPTVPASPVVAAPDPEAGHERLGPAQSGDWRKRFPDDVPRSFEDYVDSDPVRADGERRVLAFLPVGDFAPEERAALEAAVEFSALWFDLPVRTLPAEPLTDDATQSRAAESETASRRQYRTTWFLNALLPDRVPADAVVLLAVTAADLWPGRGWNFVFGQADLRRRVGVYSLARYFPAFTGSAVTEASGRLALLRTLKVVVHEAGHTFGLEHCVTWACTMNGSNSLAETDAQPLRLCPDCLRKLAWNRGLDPAARAKKLAEFLERHGLDEEASWHRAHGGAVR